MFDILNEESKSLLEKLRLKYPRAATAIELTWSFPEADKVFRDLLITKQNEDRVGFDEEAFRIISQLKFLHDSSNKNKSYSRQNDRPVHTISDPWSHTKKR